MPAYLRPSSGQGGPRASLTASPISDPVHPMCYPHPHDIFRPVPPTTLGHRFKQQRVGRTPQGRTWLLWLPHTLCSLSGPHAVHLLPWTAAPPPAWTELLSIPSLPSDPGSSRSCSTPPPSLSPTLLCTSFSQALATHASSVSLFPSWWSLLPPLLTFPLFPSSVSSFFCRSLKPPSSITQWTGLRYCPPFPPPAFPRQEAPGQERGLGQHLCQNGGQMSHGPGRPSPQHSRAPVHLCGQQHNRLVQAPGVPLEVLGTVAPSPHVANTLRPGLRVSHLPQAVGLPEVWSGACISGAVSLTLLAILHPTSLTRPPVLPAEQTLPPLLPSLLWPSAPITLTSSLWGQGRGWLSGVVGGMGPAAKPFPGLPKQRRYTQHSPPAQLPPRPGLLTEPPECLCGDPHFLLASATTQPIIKRHLSLWQGPRGTHGARPGPGCSPHLAAGDGCPWDLCVSGVGHVLCKTPKQPSGLW